MKKVITTAAAPLLILLFSYAALSKLLDIGELRWQMHNQNVPPEVADALVYLVPFSELLAAALLLTPSALRAGLWLSALLLTVFTGYIALVLAGFWADIPCSCGGVLSGLGWKQHFLFNLFFLGTAIAALMYDKKGKAENLRKE